MRPLSCHSYGFLLGLTLRTIICNAFLLTVRDYNTKIGRTMASPSTPFNMARRGLETLEEGATPLPGGMTLYVKPAQDGKSVGDCPFAHFVRMVLHEKGLEYELLPTTQENKPNWLLEGYGGKMPALRHRRECYVDSDVIAQYLDFFFQEPKMSIMGKEATEASTAVDGFFPAMAKFVKHTPNGDEEDKEKQAALEEKLQKLEEHLSQRGRTGPYLVGDGEQFALLDCSMAPKLYAMDVCLEKIKDNPIDLKGKYPAVRKYMDEVFARQSFQDTAEYGPETVVWGWTSYH
ncbi:hypothetical protein HJC23_010918 [Cyclotella cryptica]|uniref:glutathione dehydrogenase (ascorbate) n=1 Tax=Cyclotella cryptica TaxID=29204 RepID=A0ABD3QAK6_9STRA|eukprot:CCRYP_007540-RA/>CCRYP_007540-RA protein AED:0.42 eAED:0.42 QI:328/1/1/1/0.5/0.33/3/85/289